MLLLSDPLVAAVAVIDCGEDLVDLRADAALAVDPRKQDDDGDCSLLRIGVRDRLIDAQQSLPPGIRLLVVEGYRPLRLQRSHFEAYRARLSERHPYWSPERLAADTSKHVAAPAVAPHPCGAAVDLTLMRGGQELDLGTSMNATPAESADACFTGAQNISPEARQWRGVLCAALLSAGLVNYPPEWWHWSYGDRYWAVVTGAERSSYGPR